MDASEKKDFPKNTKEWYQHLESGIAKKINQEIINSQALLKEDVSSENLTLSNLIALQKNFDQQLDKLDKWGDSITTVMKDFELEKSSQEEKKRYLPNIEQHLRNIAIMIEGLNEKLNILNARISKIKKLPEQPITLEEGIPKYITLRPSSAHEGREPNNTLSHKQKH